VRVRHMCVALVILPLLEASWHRGILKVTSLTHQGRQFRHLFCGITRGDRSQCRNNGLHTISCCFRYVTLHLKKMSPPKAARAGARIIHNHGLMKPLGHPHMNAFACKYSKKYCYVASVHPAVEYPTHALHLMYAKRWQARTEPFWWNVIARKDIENRRTVRSWVARRLRQAFTESLRKMGYGPDGNRIDGEGEPLIGTAQLLPHQTIMKRKFMDLVWQTDIAVEAIIKRRNMVDPPKSSKPSTPGQYRGKRKPLYYKKAKKAPKVPEAPHKYPIVRKLRV
jgi:hypothetical protein